MGGPNEYDAAYCDIQGYDSGDVQACTEIDLIEGNAKAIQTTLHTSEGHGNDGRSCNQDGCWNNWGRERKTAHLYGPGSREGIDSSRPFEVKATFRETESWHPTHTRGALYDVTLSQSVSHPISSGGATRDMHFFDGQSVYGSHTVNGQPKAIPDLDQARTRASLLSPGMVLVLSLWSAADLSWLDGGCESWVAEGRPVCDLDATRFSISNLRTTGIPPPPPSPPPPSPPQWPPIAPPIMTTILVRNLPWFGALLFVGMSAALAWHTSGIGDIARGQLPVGRSHPTYKRAPRPSRQKHTPVSLRAEGDETGLDDVEHGSGDDTRLGWSQQKRAPRPSRQKHNKHFPAVLLSANGEDDGLEDIDLQSSGYGMVATERL